MSDFWRNKKVFLTGHTGFKGGWLSLWLQENGAKVYGYSLTPPTKPNFFSVARVSDGLAGHYIDDIRELSAITKAINTVQPEIVFHLAAQPLVRKSYLDPVETYTTNVIGTVNLFEAVRSISSVQVVLNITTDKCYENKEWVWPYREDEAMGGYDPYSSSKGCSELVTSAYRRSFFTKQGVRVASARAGNVIGGGDWADDRLIPDFLRAIDNRQNLVVRSPHAIRPWQHVLEPLSGYLTLAEKLFSEGNKYAESWNFGPSESDARDVSWIVNKLTSSVEGASWSLDSTPQPHEANYLKLDSSKARTLLGWKPRWNLDTALQNIITWHHAWKDNQDMKAFSLKQIQQYEQS